MRPSTATEYLNTQQRQPSLSRNFLYDLENGAIVHPSRPVANHCEMPGLRVDSSYGRGFGESTNDGFGLSVPGPKPCFTTG
jgi:hypothetical protein